MNRRVLKKSIEEPMKLSGQSKDHSHAPILLITSPSHSSLTELIILQPANRNTSILIYIPLSSVALLISQLTIHYQVL